MSWSVAKRTNNYVLYHGDATEVLSQMTEGSVNATITSPPYYRRKDYSVKEQIGQESSVELYIQKLKQALSEIYRITTNDGSCFFVIGDTYKDRSLLLIPHRLALAALQIGWIIRNELIWSKLDPPPDSAANRWRESHENVLFLTKSRSGYKSRMDRIRVPYNHTTIKRWGKGQIYNGPKAKKEAGPIGQRIQKGKKFKLNSLGVIPKDVICSATACSHNNHYASFPELLIEQFLLAVTDTKDTVLDPFTGTSTTGIVAIKNKRRFLGIDVSLEYIEISKTRLEDISQSNQAISCVSKK